MDTGTPKDNKKGFKTKIKSSGRSKLRLPIYCPNPDCKMITSSPMDDDSLRNYGICLYCFVTLVENREKPLINVEFYKKQLEERGY